MALSGYYFHSFIRFLMIFCNFAIGLKQIFPRHIRNIEALCSHLVYTKPRKLQKTVNKRGRNGLHAMRGAVIPTSVHNGFPRTSILRSVAYSSTLRTLIIKRLIGTERLYWAYVKDKFLIDFVFVCTNVIKLWVVVYEDKE